MSAGQARDLWSEWLLKRRFSGDPIQMQAFMRGLAPVREKVLANARLGEGETLLDVGCGDGLIAFGALQRIAASRVIFSDVSQDLLDHAHALAHEMSVLDRCRFVRASADDLSMLDQNSVDVVTTRSVLIYVGGKEKAFAHFYRVLKPSGRLSIFEPINRFRYPHPPHLFWGFDVTPVIEIAQKIKSVYEKLQPIDTDPMLNFDERDLLEFVERSGFQDIHMTLEAEIARNIDLEWGVWLTMAANPRIPSLDEAMNEVLTSAERSAFVNHLRPLVEAKKGVRSTAIAYLWATKA